MSPPQFSIQSIGDPRQLSQQLQQLSRDVAELQRRLADLTIAQSTPQLSINTILQIRDALQARGVAPLNVASLLGILAQSQRGYAVVADSASTLPNPTLYEVGTLGAVLSGTTLTFYLVQEGMPRSWVAQTALAVTAIDASFTIEDDADATKKIRFEASTIATGNTRVQTVPDTNQILAGRNVNNSFSAAQTFAAGLTSSSGLTVSTGTSLFDGRTDISAELLLTGAVVIGFGDSPYTVPANVTKVLVNTSGGAITINLTASAVTDRHLLIKDGTGNAVANNITINGNGVNIDGAASVLINTAYGYESLFVVGPNWGRGGI